MNNESRLIDLPPSHTQERNNKRRETEKERAREGKRDTHIWANRTKDGGERDKEREREE